MKIETKDRIEQMKAIRDGWFHGEGLAPSRRGLDWFSGWLECLHESYSPLIFPMIEGGVLAEWIIGCNDASLDVNLETRQGVWHVINLRTDEHEEIDIDLDDASSISEITLYLDGLTDAISKACKIDIGELIKDLLLYAIPSRLMFLCERNRVLDSDKLAHVIVDDIIPDYEDDTGRSVHLSGIERKEVDSQMHLWLTNWGGAGMPGG